MQRLAVLPDADAPARQKAPAFTPEERDTIAAWTKAISGHGLRIETYSDLYEYLEEVLLVFPREPEESSWLIHKTPSGAVAVRMWPGLANTVGTVPEALAIVTAALNQPGE
jgi:hypothetical protein